MSEAAEKVVDAAKEENCKRLDALASNRKWLNKLMWHYWWGDTACFTMEMMMAPGIIEMMMKAAPELYPDDKQKQVELVQNHCVFYNTQPNMMIVPGTVLGMEIQRAKGEDVPNDMIQSVKAALAGSFAGIGDSLVQGMFVPILTSICMGVSANGSALGAILLWVVFFAIMYPLGFYLFKLGINMGTNGVNTILSGEKKDRLINAITILGCTVVGSVVASISHLALGWTISSNGLDVAVEDYMNQIYPGLTSLLFFFLIYTLMTKKKIGALKMILYILLFSIVAYFIHMF